MTRRRPSRPRAFTLVELVATMVVLGAIGSIAATLMFGSLDGYLDATARAQLHAEASIGLDRIVRELRAVPLDDAASDIAPDIDSIADTAIAWKGDSSLGLSGSSLLLVLDGGASAVLLGDVDDFTISAWDESGAALALPRSGAACDAVRRLTISITLARAGVGETLRTDVFLRCTVLGAGS